MIDKRNREFVDTLYHDVKIVMKDYGLDNSSSDVIDCNDFIQDFISGKVTPTSPENTDMWADGKYRGWDYEDIPSKDVGLSNYEILMKFSKDGEEDILVVLKVTPCVRYTNPPQRVFRFMVQPPIIVGFKKTVVFKGGIK